MMKTKHKYFLSGLLITTLVYSGLNESRIISIAKAESKSKQCVWSYVKDSNGPEIGEVGKIEMDEDWTKMSNGGWKLITNNGQFWVFEKCS